MNLLVDIGNTRLKWAREQDGVIDFRGAIDYRRFDVFALLEQEWRKLSAPDSLLIASVAATRQVADLTELALGIWPSVAIVNPRSAASAFGVVNAYRQADKLGIDRWLAILAAHRHYPGANCIADCGTAITVDVVDADGRHLGGVICPGLRSMKKALEADTETLAYTPVTGQADLADNTAAAIDAGSALAAAALIDAVFRKQSKPCRLILCGGDTDVIAKLLESPFVCDPNLVLKGLGLFCESEPVA